MTLIDEQLHEILAGCKKATPGKWRQDTKWQLHGGTIGLSANEGIVVNELNHIIAEVRQKDDDAAHMARCDPHTIREMIEELLELRDWARLTPPSKLARMRNAALEEAAKKLCCSTVNWPPRLLGESDLQLGARVILALKTPEWDNA